MLEIYPFQGWYYNQSILNDLSTVVTPPYDNISPADRQHYRAASEYNFVNLILNDAPGDQRYPEAARLLEKWTTQEILIQDSIPAFYLLTQTYDLNSRPVTRTGIIAELKLEELGTGVLPHERTFPKHIRDRYQLMETTSANLGQIFMSYRDRGGTVELLADQIKARPILIDFNRDGIHFQVWRITDPAMITRIQAVISQDSVIIADGHHRYKTALEFNHDHPELPGSDRVMVTLVNAYDPGMEILPIHRLIKDVKIQPGELTSRLETQFNCHDHQSVSELLAELESFSSMGTNHIGLIDTRNSTFRLLEYSPPEPVLDATVLHDIILKKIAGIDTNAVDQTDQVTYLRGVGIKDYLDQHLNDYDLVALLRPPVLDQVFNLAEQGRVMPQKTTYFFPKVYSGIILRRFK